MKEDYMKSTEVQNWNWSDKTNAPHRCRPLPEDQNMPILDSVFKLIPPHQYTSMLPVF